MATDSDFTSFCLVEGKKKKKETTNKKKKKNRLAMLVMVGGGRVRVEGLQLTI